MEKQKQLEYKVGTFVLAGTILTAIFVITLGGNTGFFQRSSYLSFEAPDSLGLSPGSVVKLSGVPCGNVSDIEFNDDSQSVNIVMRINKKYMPRVTQGSIVSVFTQGALGDKYIDIAPGPASNPQYKDGDIITGEIGGDLFATIGKSADKFETVFHILENVNTLLASLNKKQVGSNVGDTAINLKRATASLAAVLGNGAKNNELTKSLAHLSSILEKIDKGQGTLGSLVNDPTVHEDLKSLLGGAKRNKLLKYLIRSTIQEGEEVEAPVSKK